MGDHLQNEDQSRDTTAYRRARTRPLSKRERRRRAKKRLRELRRRKRNRERAAGANDYPRARAVALVLFFVFLLVSCLLAWAGRGGDTGSQLMEIPASNLAGLQGLVAQPGEIGEPNIPARAAFLLDTSTGEALYEKNADEELPMASTTKIMTAIVVLENASLEEHVVISERASATGESSAWLEKGEVLTVDQLLHALMVQSANDSATALAEHVAGSVESFVEMMNRKCEELGAAHTHFANPHGLDERGHYTTARDLALIASYAMKNHVFRELVVSDGYQIPWPGHPYPRVLENRNKFLKLYPYANGIKTGYTDRAGKCLVASASRDGRELISVILNGGDSYWDQTIMLMNYGFDCFARVEYAYAGQVLARVQVGDFPRKTVALTAGRDLAFTVRRDHLSRFLVATLSYPRWLPYPVVKGQEIGQLAAGEGSPDEIREPVMSEAACRPPNFLARIFAFLYSVLVMWWRWIRWLIPGL